jgi:hypothetical protein
MRIRAPEKKNFQESFERYVEKTKKHSKVGYEEACTLVHEGEAFLRRLKGGELTFCSRAEKRKYIIPFTWWLMARATDKGQGFLQGMFVFEDPNHTIASFFSSAAYKRSSSHYHGRIIGGNLGIDAPSQLPYGFRTVLFGKLQVRENDGEWTFLKPENYGLESFPELLCHGTDYVFDRIFRLFGHQQGKHDKKEDMLPSFLANKKSMKHSGFVLNKQKISQWGISGLFQAIEPYVDSPEKVTQLPLQQRQSILQFAQNAYSSSDWLHIRYGNEVVISERPDPYKSKLEILIETLKACI